MLDNDRPTFKTATPTSRTQLKQQLQREQLQELERQELERRENEGKHSIINNNGGPSLSSTSSLHSNQSQTNVPQFNQHQFSIPRDNYGSNSSLCLTSSPTPSTSTNGSDFSTSQYSNQPNHFDSNSQQSTAPLKVPLHIGVDLPPQVLKVSAAITLTLCLFFQISKKNYSKNAKNKKNKTVLFIVLGSNGARESNAIPCYTKAKESSETIFERIISSVRMDGSE